MTPTKPNLHGFCIQITVEGPDREALLRIFQKLDAKVDKATSAIVPSKDGKQAVVSTRVSGVRPVSAMPDYMRAFAKADHEK